MQPSNESIACFCDLPTFGFVLALQARRRITSTDETGDQWRIPQLGVRSVGSLVLEIGVGAVFAPQGPSR
jgi:hypothetical protein